MGELRKTRNDVSKNKPCPGGDTERTLSKHNEELDLRLSCRWIWRVLSAGTWRCVGWEELFRSDLLPSSSRSVEPSKRPVRIEGSKFWLLLASFLTYFSIHKMEAIRSSETSVTTRLQTVISHKTVHCTSQGAILFAFSSLLYLVGLYSSQLCSVMCDIRRSFNDRRLFNDGIVTYKRDEERLNKR
jgi:hypothetical protein